MPRKQSHRGKHPKDAHLFASHRIPTLRNAVKDLSFLLSRGYAEKAAQKLVGDHYQLALRQRRAVLGASCSDEARVRRHAHRLGMEDLRGKTLAIDGYNLLIITESALSGGILLRGMDGCIRDLASVHGSYRRVEETLPAIELIGHYLRALGIAQVNWYFDAPVSNSGRLKVLLQELARAHGWPWHIELEKKTDQRLAHSDAVVVTSDGWILDRAHAWTNLAGALVTGMTPPPHVIDLG